MSDDQKREDASNYELLALFDQEDEAAAETVRQRCANSQQDRETVAAAALVERLLGSASDAHPRTIELLAFVENDLEHGARTTVERHLSSCPSCRQLVTAARSGLGEAEQIERGLWWLAAGKPSATPEAIAESALPPILPLAITRPHAVAMAADATPAPLPQERHLLAAEQQFELVYLRRGGRAQLGLFSDERGVLEISVTLDSRELAPTVDDDGAVLFDLGPVATLFGQHIDIALRGAVQGRWRWTFIEDDDKPA